MAYSMLYSLTVILSHMRLYWRLNDGGFAETNLVVTASVLQGRLIGLKVSVHLQEETVLSKTHAPY